MNRQQLLDFATRYLAWMNKKPTDETTFSTLVSRDVSIPIEYPGATPTYDGTIKFMQDIHAASHDINFEIIDTCVDEFQCSITLILRAVGTHSGSPLMLTLLTCLGIGLVFRQRGRNLRSKVLLC